jgi:hypothetical protein
MCNGCQCPITLAFGASDAIIGFYRLMDVRLLGRFGLSSTPLRHRCRGGDGRHTTAVSAQIARRAGARIRFDRGNGRLGRRGPAFSPSGKALTGIDRLARREQICTARRELVIAAPSAPSHAPQSPPHRRAAGRACTPAVTQPDVIGRLLPPSYDIGIAEMVDETAVRSRVSACAAWRSCRRGTRRPARCGGCCRGILVALA